MRKPLIEKRNYNYKFNSCKRTHVRKIVEHQGSVEYPTSQYDYNTDLVLYRCQKQLHLSITQRVQREYIDDMDSLERVDIELTQKTITRLIEELTGLLDEETK